jgi:sensor histidine kinase regulating citrate/malate metabolism
MTIFLVYTIFFKLMAISHEKLKIQQEANQTRCLLTIQQEQHRRIDQSIKDSRKMRHDLRHHMVVIQGFLNSGDTAQAQAYVENCMASMSRFETTRCVQTRL